METTTRLIQWLAAVSARLQQQWPRIDPAQLDELALDLWRDEKLRAMEPERAAEDWLRPVNADAV